MGPCCLFKGLMPRHRLSSGGGTGVYWFYTPSYRPPGNFSYASENAQRVKLFICSELFICVFEILNPGGPLISMIFFCCYYFVRGIKGFKLIYNKHLYFFYFYLWCCDPSVCYPARSGSP